MQLSGASTATASFTALEVGPNGEILTFELTVTDQGNSVDTDTVNIPVNNPTSSDDGGGGFIASAIDGSPMALNGMLNWKQRIYGYISLLTPRTERAATSSFTVTMVVFIGACLAYTLRKPRNNGHNFN